MFKLILKKRPFLFKLRLFLGLIFLLFIIIFLYFKIVPFGHISYTRNYLSRLGSGKGFIFGFTPADRIDLNGGNGPQLIGDPVYFSVFTPRTFDRVKMTIIYRDNLDLNTSLIEAGVLVDNVVWRYDLKPIDNKALDYLMRRWSKSEANGVLFLQKDKNYDSLSAFEADLARGQLKNCNNPQDNCLALYNYTPKYNYQIVNYRPALPLILKTPLRGAHQFYVYVKNEPLRLEFSLVDLNQDSKPAPINITLWSGEKIIETKTVLDDNLRPGSGKIEGKQVILDQPTLPTGVYKVEIKITDDMVIKQIKSSVDRLAFINKVWPVSSSEPLKLYTDANFIQVKALTPASLQTLTFGDREFKLAEAYQQFNFKIEADSKINELDFKKDDIIIENNGVFAWSPASLFNPSLPRVDNNFSVKNPIKYIIADYQQPAEAEGIKTASVEFNLKEAYRENGKYSFMISVPGLKTSAGVKNNLEIYQIKMELTGRTLWQKIWQ